ncbi:glycosyltransferase family 2 protein [Collinsella sp. An7]|uniref:glycosyltransferase family 2 protein n=1 Tax=Collinsella sp. An7 TaxID=1965651 RepID=UPI001EF5BB91|nr:glycosyltransferase family 2 protein [Collinsella sp. An7]
MDVLSGVGAAAGAESGPASSAHTEEGVEQKLCPADLRPAPVLALVIPCFNEASVLPRTAPLFLAALSELAAHGAVDPASYLMVVDDGSTDDTWAVVRALATADRRVRGVRLSRNRGQQNALAAGLDEVRGHCDAVITLDADGQDDPSVLPEMVARYRAGYDVVFGVRSRRDCDGAVKRLTARAFYRLLGLLGAEVVPDHADFRLMAAPVLEALADFTEVNLYLRGLVPLVGFKSCEVAYERAPRAAGWSRYSVGRMLGLALDGVTSLSIRPIRLITVLGLIIALGSVAGIVWAIVTVATGHAVSGWASMICAIFFLGGVQLVSLGVIGEYVGKTYLEAKARPRYIVAERVGNQLRADRAAR